ncbi:fructose transport system substrate-binding protein [Amycolatopsis arida]|uniref:Fructose transport system substrate-binding protein n=1 Tax=Amycolatopsis arida TaxID=587909 RepID=A0A1I5T621_9PSEU|nr:substrate-binding domain-containing protein [Amycolatopsis arida]TDX96216.1 fructose transport system substrate-binding protein [Amycolatopsis arida]SFP78492.1 fructose transport system substrate-binding protein [Amycolatopsis arida]
MRIRGLAIGAVLLTVLGTGCTVERHWGGSTGAGDGPVTIGLVTKTDTNPFFISLRDAASAAAAAHGAELTALAGQFDGDNDGQVRAIENLMQRGVDTILITPSSSTGVLDAIDRARGAGILVLALDTATEPADAVDATIATNNLEAGRKQGAYVRAALGATPARLFMIDGTPGSTVDTFRHNGFLEGIGLTDGDPAIRGREPANGDQHTAQQKVENLLQRTTDVNAVYTMNEPTARGAHAALRGRGLTDQVVMGSIDGGCEGVRNVRDGMFDATVMQFPAKMAEQGVAAAVEYGRTGAKPSGFIDTGSVVITDRPVPGVESQDTAWGLEHCWGDA